MDAFSSMRAGRLRWRVELQQNQDPTALPAGEQPANWQTVIADLPACLEWKASKQERRANQTIIVMQGTLTHYYPHKVVIDPRTMRYLWRDVTGPGDMTCRPLSIVGLLWDERQVWLAVTVEYVWGDSVSE
jgi:hypothetical protein